MSFSKNIPQNSNDVSSLSNFDKIAQTNYEVSLYINFQEQIFEGSVDIDFDILDSSVKSILLDTKKLKVHKVSLTSGNELKFKVHNDHISTNTLGSPLEILLPEDFSDKVSS